MGIMHSKRLQMIGRLAALTAVCVFMFGAVASSALAGPALKIFLSQPSSALPGQPMEFLVQALNVGDAATSGPITFTDTASTGLELQTNNRGYETESEGIFGSSSDERPQDYTKHISCVTSTSTGTCSIPWILPPGGILQLRIRFVVPLGTSGTPVNTLTFSGGGTLAPASEEQPVDIEPRGPFAFSNTLVELSNVDRSPVVQAGVAPPQFATILKYRSFVEAANTVDNGRLATRVHWESHDRPGVLGTRARRTRGSPTSCVSYRQPGGCRARSGIGCSR
jgi:hypothetical protein